MGSEIEIFNNKFSEIEDHINNNNNSLNDYVSSLELNNENHHKVSFYYYIYSYNFYLLIFNYLYLYLF